MKIGIFYNPEKFNTTKTLEDFSSFLTQNGFAPQIFTDEKKIKNIEVLLVFGGDGTILRTVDPCVKNEITVIGVNFGTVGFLAEIEKEEKAELLTILRQIEDGSAKIIRRSVLEITLGGSVFYALNEIALRRNYESDNSTMLKAEAYTDSKYYDTVSGDGILVCTPTGSTAYSLSAGGPILDPETPALVLTPLCAFSLRAKPVVFPDTHTVEIAIKNGTAILLIDGVKSAVLSENDKIMVKKSEFSMNFAVKSDYFFYERLHRKLR